MSTTIPMTPEQVAALVGAGTPTTAAPVAFTANLLDRFVGRNILVRTVTMTICGRLTEHDGTFMLVDQASWIADSGRWNEAVSSGSFSEVEPFTNGPILVGIGAVIDLTTVNFDPPTTVK